MVSGFKIPLQRVQRGSSNQFQNNLALSNSRNFAYLAFVGIGGQNLSVIFDTGSSDLWVVSSDCHDPDCQNVATYAPTTSLSLTSVMFKLNYLMGSVSGIVGFETVTLGPYRIFSQVFAIANQTSGLGLSSTGNSGILGLAFPSEASISSTSGHPFLQNLASHFPDTQKYFAVKLAPHESSSSFTVGELDPLYANSTSEFNWTPVYKGPGSVYDYWKLPLRGFTINGTSLTGLSISKVSGSNSSIAVLDTGTTLLLGPSSDVEYFWNSVGSVKQDDNGLWRVRCNRGVVVRVMLGDETDAHEYVMDPQDISWMGGGTDGEWCMGGVQANDDVSEADWLMGDVFLRNVYVSHQLEIPNSPPQIGLIGTTDIDRAMASFWTLRGYDSNPTGIMLANHVRTSQNPASSVVYGASVVAGFVAGTIFTLIFLFRRGKFGTR